MDSDTSNELSKEQSTQLKEGAKAMRLDVLRLAHGTGKRGAHIAPSLSSIEILVVLHNAVMKLREDIFILSKGHGGLAYYTALHQAGLISKEQLDTFDEPGGDFPGQPSKKESLGIDYSSGSLGMGLSYGAGRAKALKSKGSSASVFVLLGDGELNEGSVWEAAMFASHAKLDNLIAIVDVNGMQSDGFSKDILNMDVKRIWDAFGWNVIDCNGHDVDDLYKAFARAKLHEGCPHVLLASTVKGEGVSFMRNVAKWHHSPLSDSEYEQARNEVNSCGV